MAGLNGFSERKKGGKKRIQTGCQFGFSVVPLFSELLSNYGQKIPDRIIPKKGAYSITWFTCIMLDSFSLCCSPGLLFHACHSLDSHEQPSV